MAYLHSKVHENDNLDLFAFSDLGATFTLNSEFEAYLFNHLKEGAVVAFNIQTGRGNKAPTVKYLSGCPKQPRGIECGYVVMRHVKEIVMDSEMSFIKKWSAKSRKLSCSRAELDEVRCETAGNIEQFL
ncbi:hypothetical protein POM88_028924 [Heracleum sosnowskyi]|uniref:Uncharacterized protein n=1 Tax=Heracleum sosnowskyi TaxID=360622 RepID=A0AAD8HTS7_9APIA|nr:hypothetical protein POM88_028922 [Heracleum sosnowskyi]KAK1372731.1 hypothetical protein POM88_028924 [Heracleum sosnowskyi]